MGKRIASALIALGLGTLLGAVPARAGSVHGTGWAKGRGVAHGRGVFRGQGVAHGTGVVIYRGADGQLHRRRGTGTVHGRGIAIGRGTVAGRGAAVGRGRAVGQGRAGRGLPR